MPTSLLEQLVEQVAGSFVTCSRMCSNWVVVLPVGIGAVWDTPSRATDTSRTPVLEPWQFVEQMVGIFMAWFMATASWLMSTAAGEMLSTGVDVESSGTTVGTRVAIAARTEVATQLALVADGEDFVAEEAVAAESSKSSSAEIGVGSVMMALSGVAGTELEVESRGT